jgi:hypothetical protein
MDIAWIKANWALAIAAVIGLGLSCALAAHLFHRSARGQLRRVRKTLAAERRKHRNAQARVVKAEQRKSKLQRRADRVKPRALREADEALADARALARIAGDRLAIAENHLRRVIFEEFPPTRHERLRMKYLPDRPAADKPFTF